MKILKLFTLIAIQLSVINPLKSQCYFTTTGDTTSIKTCKYTLENVVWKNHVGTASTLNNITKPAGIASWDSDAVSENKVYNNGFVQTIIAENNSDRMIGLNTVNSNTSYTDLEYAFFLTWNGTFQIYESGSGRGTWGYYQTGDTLRISVMNSTVFYIQNNHIVYTSTVTPSLPMFVDISMNTVGSTLKSVVVGNGTDSIYNAYEANPGVPPTYQWKLNGGNVGANIPTYTNNLTDGDSLECVLTPGIGGCSLTPVTSNTIHIKSLPIDFDINFFIENDSILNGSCKYLSERIRWESISSDYLNGSNNVSKNSGIGAWNVGGFSHNRVEDGGFLQFIASETTTSRMIGLNAVNTNVSYTDIDYAFYLQGAGVYGVYENGSSKGNWGSYSTGDTMQIAVVGNEVRYVQNGNVVYTSTIAPTLPLYVDFSINSIGATIQNISVSNPTYGRFKARTYGMANVNYQWKLNGGNVGTNSTTYTNTSLSTNDVITCDFYISQSTECGGDTTFTSNSITVLDQTPKKNLIFSIRNDSIVNSSCKYAFEEVSWQSISGLTQSGSNNLVKTSGTNSWTTGAFSYNMVKEGGYMMTIADETNKFRMIGLSSSNTNMSYNDIDYAIYMQNGGIINIYENGINRGNWGSFSTGDTLKIAVVGNEVRYIQNSNVIYTSLVAPTLPLFVDLSINSVGGTLKNIYVNNTTYGKYSAFVSGASSVKYQWKLNGANVGTDSPTYTNTGIANGDSISCELTLTNTLGCSSDTVAYSNKIFINEQDLTSSVIFSIRNDSIIDNSCLFANEQVSWQSISGLTLNGTNNVTKTSGVWGWWDVGGFSYNKVDEGGFMQTIAFETTTDRMIGLNAVNTNVNYTEIDYTFYLQAGNALSIFENGVFRGNYGTYSTGDTLRIAVINNQVLYIHNGNVIYTSAVAPSLPLYVDMSLATTGATLKDITVYNGLYGKFTAYVNGASSVSYQWKLNGGNVGANSPTYINTSLSNADIITCVLSINGTSGCNGDTLITSNTITINEENLNSFSIFFITKETTARNGCQYAVEDVYWKSVSGVTKSSNNLTKSGGILSWNTGAISGNSINSNGYFQFVASETNKSRMIGLNSNHTTFNYVDIDYAFYLIGGGALHVYENGTNIGSVGTYSTNDTLRIEAVGNTVKYIKNNNVLYTSLVAPTFPLYVDASINSVGGTLNNAQIGNATHGNFIATYQNVGTSPSFQWKLNGVNVGTNSPSYSNDTLKHNDEITCVLTPDFQNCSSSTPTSNKITIKDNPPTNMLPSFTATNSTWLGTNTSWYDPTNWSAGVPRSGYNAIIPTGLGNYPSIPTRAYLYSMDVAAGASVSLSSNAHLSVYDEWTNAGSFTTNVGMVEFKTCVDTSRWSSTIPVTIYDMKINNTKGMVISNGNMHISDSLIFSKGIIYNNDNEIVFDDNSSWKWASNTSYINGEAQKTGNDAFTFPVGDSSVLRPASISAPSIATDHFTTRYYKKNAHPTYDKNLKDASIDHVSTCEYWIIDRTGGSSNVSVTLSWNNPTSCGVNNLSQLLVSRWDGTMWKDHGNGGTTGNVTTGTVISSAPVTTFSPFTLATTTSNNPLPVQLLNFEAELNKKVVNLKWMTETEINNDFFTVERSKGLSLWIEISEVKGAGNSNYKLSYSAIDQNPLDGISYYRLKQTDFNGEYSYSDIESVNNKNLNEFLIYPNPVKDILFIKTQCSSCFVKIYSSIGQLIYSGNLTEINTSSWSNGLYKIVITDNIGNIFNSDVIKN
ncbi:MAG: T9SS type A sorting domain-containing protein [Flavobacteriales bacterium]|nr:T9SS type A sorting domain-containing protein [Flavobacteriales bacterium]